jgi:hypothetical protein
MCLEMSTEIMLSSRPQRNGEPNRRQQMALERIEYAVSELSSVLLANCHAREATHAAIGAVRRAVKPIIAEVLAAD